MTTWHYRAVRLADAGTGVAQTGQVSGDSAASVRRSLRSAGLQVVELETVRRDGGGRGLGRGTWLAHLRARRRAARAELYDSLATMLDAGLPLLDSLETCIRGIPDRSSRRRLMLARLRDGVRSGASLDQGMVEHPSWFDPVEIALVRAGVHGGNLAEVLRGLSRRHEEANDLRQKVVGALTYPAVITCVGLGVLVFLSSRTLPELVGILEDAGLEAPALTRAVIATGAALTTLGPWILAAALAGGLALLALREGASQGRWQLPRWWSRLSPRLARRLAVARVSTHLADLVRGGIPMVEGLRILAPTAGHPDLGRRLREAAEELEQGHELSRALGDERWFEPEFQRLVDVGRTTGELDRSLARIGLRYERQSRRLLERLTALLEPLVILILALLVGTVVVAAVLPMVQLQEILS